MNRLKIYLIITLSVIFSVSYSQEEATVKKIRFALDLGVDFPNKHYAKFLNGNHPFGVSRILGNQIYRQEIETQLGYPILNWEFSEVNTYNPTVYAGLYMGFDIKPDILAIMKVNFSVLRFATPFVIALNNPQNFTGEFEQEIEEIISESIGTILLAVGEAMISDDSSYGSEQRLATFDDRIETMGKDLELEISASTNALAQKAEAFCLKLSELDKVESEIHRSIKALKQFNLIETNKL